MKPSPGSVAFYECTINVKASQRKHNRNPAAFSCTWLRSDKINLLALAANFSAIAHYANVRARAGFRAVRRSSPADFISVRLFLVAGAKINAILCRVSHGVPVGVKDESDLRRRKKKCSRVWRIRDFGTRRLLRRIRQI
jgi:hypothetical protein